MDKTPQVEENKNTVCNLEESAAPDEPFNTPVCDKKTMEQLKSLEEPKKEIILDPNSITELEKVMHSDYFEGRAAKTPSRYLKVKFTKKGCF